jgi:hypothetical protein
VTRAERTSGTAKKAAVSRWTQAGQCMPVIESVVFMVMLLGCKFVDVLPRLRGCR